MVSTRSYLVRQLQINNTVLSNESGENTVDLVVRLRGGPRNAQNAVAGKKRQTSPRRVPKSRSKSPKTSRSPIRKHKSKSATNIIVSHARHEDGFCLSQVVIKPPGSANKRTTPTQSTRNDERTCDVFPARAWGEAETVGLSKIGRADKEIEIWEEVYRVHEKHLPDALPSIKQSLSKARRDRAALDNSLEANLTVGDPDPAATEIESRLEALEWGLESSKFEPEKQNIRGAIAAYKSGAIDYSDHYTLLYAGKVVDTAPTYSEVVRDREERLDRYAKAYGAHWLWWEPPLKVIPQAVPHSMGSISVKADHTHTQLHLYRIAQGFWKRTAWVSRMPMTANSQYADFPQRPDGSVHAGAVGPKLSFTSILDSGATYPNLHTADLTKLGVAKESYACQSITKMRTAGGEVFNRLYELFVCVLDEDGQNVIEANDRLFADAPGFLGSLCPVAETLVDITYDAQGREIDLRLSGLLPFLACYMSSTPTRNRIWFGEDRNDVLGHQRMPGQKRWDITFSNENSEPDLPEKDYGNPLIKFTHRGGLIVDEDDPDRGHVSVTTYKTGPPDGDVRVVSDPGEEWLAQKVKNWRPVQLY